MRPGSAKETAFIHHVDQRINKISRKLAKRDGSAEPEARREMSKEDGYQSFRQVGRDIDCLLGIVWVSGTPSLQIPYLMTLALIVLNSMSGFPPAPRTLFRILQKLDAAFAALIDGMHYNTGETLPGVESGQVVTATEKVRIKSLAQRTRVAVVELMQRGELLEAEEQDEESSASDIGVEDEGPDINMQVAKVYDQTLVELGDTLGGPAIGIMTDE